MDGVGSAGGSEDPDAGAPARFLVGPPGPPDTATAAPSNGDA